MNEVHSLNIDIRNMTNRKKVGLVRMERIKQQFLGRHGLHPNLSGGKILASIFIEYIRSL